MIDALKNLWWVIVFTVGLMISMILTIIGAVCYCIDQLIDQLGELIIGVAYKLIDAMDKKANEVFRTEGEDSVWSTDSEEK